MNIGSLSLLDVLSATIIFVFRRLSISGCPSFRLRGFGVVLNGRGEVDR
jgi:hypothetical protein